MKNKSKICFELLFIFGLGFAFFFQELLDHLRLLYILYFIILYIFGSHLVVKNNQRYKINVFKLILLGLATYASSLLAIFYYHTNSWFDYTPLYYLALISVTHLIVFIIFTARSYERSKSNLEISNVIEQPFLRKRTLISLVIISITIIFYGTIISFVAVNTGDSSICNLIITPDARNDCFMIWTMPHRLNQFLIFK